MMYLVNSTIAARRRGEIHFGRVLHSLESGTSIAGLQSLCSVHNTAAFNQIVWHFPEPKRPGTLY